MLVSAVLDPYVLDFDDAYFDDLYMINAEDLLKGIKKNGVLIVDSGKNCRMLFGTGLNLRHSR